MTHLRGAFLFRLSDVSFMLKKLGWVHAVMG
ncbi:hypothetical protein PQA65_gp18 [Yersinia phage vB_YenM_42.18]|uniref:Uncharacterized protein n=1 Tax=Yersinia phage vB_YenM_42.18 TaxID=2918926 RepID=A0AAE9FQK1_9CAUD|nr:hypothetical protein PQA65_gp18 [Yersinia phage vB_YenM_42.18]UNA05732.1 hypothetical protein vBYenM4218_018 [Yersinia phage vB_YenM_42.18]